MAKPKPPFFVARGVDKWLDLLAGVVMLKEGNMEKLSRLKGFKKDPFLYLGMVAMVLFLVVSFATSKQTFNSPLHTENPQNQERVFLVPGKIIKESPDLSLIQNNSLAAISPPIMVTPQVLGALLEGSEYTAGRREIIEYTVKEGDSLWSIATEFNISIDTIVWANNIQSDLIRPGQKLLILPVDGLMHLVKEGDTISKLAEEYKTKSEKIIAFNELKGEGDIFEGEVLIVPDGKMPFTAEIEPSTLAGLSTNDFHGQSHHYPYGQCTWWVAQKRAIPAWGNAREWLNNAIAYGYSVHRGRYGIPREGAVIILTGHRLGHVGYVEEVAGDKVKFSEMNYLGWGRMNYRILNITHPSIIGYIY